MTSIAQAVLASTTFTDLLSRGRERAVLSGRPVLVSLAQRIPSELTPLAVFAAGRKALGFRTFWGRPEQDFWLVGHGQAHVLKSNGADYVDIIARRHRALVSAAVSEGPDVRGVGPLLMGGFRYDTCTARDSAWDGFPDALMVLPSYLFTWSKGSRWLTINAMVASETDPLRQAEATMDELRSLEGAHTNIPAQPTTRDTVDISYNEWQSRVNKALEDIKRGYLTKVVLARKKVLQGCSRYLPESALAQLCRAYPGCSVFAVDYGHSSFVGASPETLARVEGRRLSLTCLASSAARGGNTEEDYRLARQLEASSKEQREHSAVVAMLTAALKDICRDLRWETRPQVWKLKNVQHLLTPFTGDLADGYGVLDVVKRLHPTPAVGGVPTDHALRLIRDLEGDRGWYAAPVGWLDHTSSGEFAVAIRSALVSGDRAVLYAGAGIIDGSDPEQEFRETEMKFQPMLTALRGG